MRMEKADWWTVIALVAFMVIMFSLVFFMFPKMGATFSTINTDRYWSVSGPTQTPGPSPTPPPTPTSTSTPLPIPPSLMPGDFGILSRVPCGPPCFQGIRPGITTFADASLMLPCSVRDLSPGKLLLCSSGDTQISVATYGLCSSDSTEPMVGGIGLTLPGRITLGDFIAAYGQPESALIAWGPQSALAYQSLQTFVFFSMQPGQQTYTFAPDTTISQVVYVTAAEYLKCLQMSIRDEQSWAGYGTYKPNP